MKKERIHLRNARCENPLSLLTRLLSKWLKPCWGKPSAQWRSQLHLFSSLSLLLQSCIDICYYSNAKVDEEIS